MTSLICPLGPSRPFTREPHHTTPGLWTEAKQKNGEPLKEERDREGDKNAGPGTLAGTQELPLWSREPATRPLPPQEVTGRALNLRLRC